MASKKSSKRDVDAEYEWACTLIALWDAFQAVRDGGMSDVGMYDEVTKFLECEEDSKKKA